MEAKNGNSKPNNQQKPVTQCHLFKSLLTCDQLLKGTYMRCTTFPMLWCYHVKIVHLFNTFVFHNKYRSNWSSCQTQILYINST